MAVKELNGSPDPAGVCKALNAAKKRALLANLWQDYEQLQALEGKTRRGGRSGGGTIDSESSDDSVRSSASGGDESGDLNSTGDGDTGEDSRAAEDVEKYGEEPASLAP
ncbi:hypothetical protein DL762_000557 [Monosporascus cannonballus]|uniref:Uncharacterized protein n=1 Tax=Monosporascus cannonballus TaxID=155416 RepID=A0ABY0HIU6_9PEZI|nr:hypothetical protein DL762_000557 [Monosporascus cannonballus]